MICKKIFNKTCLQSMLAVSMLLLVSSCARKIHITHNSFANIRSIPQGFAFNSSFAVETINKETPMLAQEIAQKIGHILENKGYVIKDDTHADYYLIFDYDMEQSKKTVNVEKYIPGETITSYGSVLSNGKAKIYEGQTHTPGSFVYVPEVHTFFTKSITIQVFDAQSYRQQTKHEPLWQGSAVCCDEHDDLRDTLDYLLVTALKYFGRNTQKYIETTVSSDDKEVSTLRTELFSLPKN